MRDAYFGDRRFQAVTVTVPAGPFVIRLTSRDTSLGTIWPKSWKNNTTRARESARAVCGAVCIYRTVLHLRRSRTRSYYPMFSSGKGKPIVTLLSSTSTSPSYAERVKGNPYLQEGISFSVKLLEQKLVGWPVSSSNFLSDGKVAIYAGRGFCTLLHLHTGRAMQLLPDDGNHNLSYDVTHCAVTDDASLAAAIVGTQLLVLRCDDRQSVVADVHADRPLLYCAFGPRFGKDLPVAAVDVAGGVMVWSAMSGTVLAELAPDASSATATGRRCCCFAGVLHGACRLAIGDPHGMRIWTFAIPGAAGGAGGESNGNHGSGENGTSRLTVVGDSKVAVELLVCDHATVPRLLSCEFGGCCKLWDLFGADVHGKGGQPRLACELPGHAATVRDASFSSTARLVVTLCERNAIRVFDSCSGAPLASLEASGGLPFLQSVGLSPDDAPTDDHCHGEVAEENRPWLIGLGMTRLNEAQLVMRPLPAMQCGTAGQLEIGI